MDVAGGLSLVQTVLQVLDSAVCKETHSVLGVKSQLYKLKKTMSTIDAILRDAEEQERQHHGFPSYGERDRLERLKEALYQVDDLFDEVTTLAHRKKLMPGNKLSKEVFLFFSQFNQLRSAVNWSQEIKSIRERLDDVVKDHQLAGGFRHSVVLEDSCVRNNPRESHSYVNLENDVIIGRDDDKRVLIDMLLDTTVEGNVSVVTIVGIGGLGKTTLAQLVYNDDRISKEFPLKIWVCVSDDFNVKVLAAQILGAATKQGYQIDGLTMDHLQVKLREVLDRNKYLLVLDDVWNENSEEWQKMKTLLFGGGMGSKVLVTSRSKKVADVVGSHRTHELKGLSDDESLDLLQKMALKPEEYPKKPQLVDIGKEIVLKCANVPLAIRVVGSLLRGQGESKWENLKNTDLANIIQDEVNGIVPVLKISFNYFPFHLKRCFSYCAVFPKDYKIVKEDLIRLWMAQGFIMPSNGESFEDAGEEYFNQLLQRCFFQDVELAEGTTNKIISCKMHDLVHDLAKEVAGMEILSCNYSTECFTEKTRHVFFGCFPEGPFDNLIELKRTRTFLCNGVRFFPDVMGLIEIISKMKCLRALSLRWGHLCRQKLASAICTLLHLRYLDFSYSRCLHVLPSSITNLYNLQTLILHGCENLERLPMELGKLVNLRHLDIYGCSRLTCMPSGMSNMKFLKNLTMFVVGGTSNVRYGGSTGVGELVNLEIFTSHSEILEISVQEGERYIVAEAREEGFLSKSRRLRKIKYCWWDSNESDGNDNARALLQSLQPHSFLRSLELLEYPGVRLPIWMMNLKTCLPNLVEMDILRCKRLEHLPLTSQLSHLKVLKLQGLNEVEYVESRSSVISGDDDDELVFFPSLEKLLLRKMPKLKGWWKPTSESGKSETPQAPMLSHLTIVNCPNLTTLFPRPEFNDGALGSSMNLKTCLPNLVEIEIANCSRLEHLPLMRQLRHLKALTLSNLCAVEYMESSSNKNSGDDDELVFFPSLEKLALRIMPKLKGCWKSSLESGNGDKPQLAKLSDLEIRSCPDLTTFPFCPKLEKLELHNFNEALGPIMRETTFDLSSPSLCSLKEVKTDNVGYLNSLPIHSYPKFSLYNYKCERLPIGEMVMLCRSGCMSSLRSLEVEYCCKLKSISGRGIWEHFTTLESLTLYGLDELVLEDENDVSRSTTEGCHNEGSDAEMPWRYLAPTLRSLKLDNLPKVVKLPQGMGCLSSLQSLNIFFAKIWKA